MSRKAVMRPRSAAARCSAEAAERPPCSRDPRPTRRITFELGLVTLALDQIPATRSRRGRLSVPQDNTLPIRLDVELHDDERIDSAMNPPLVLLVFVQGDLPKPVGIPNPRTD